MSYLSVIGAGSWGTTLSCLLAEKGFDVSLWVYEQELCEEMRRTRINSIYLSGFVIPDSIVITSDIEAAVSKSRYIVTAVPTQHIRPILVRMMPYVQKEAVIVNVSKGIEQRTLLTVSSIVRETTDRSFAVLSGPSFAREVIRKLPSAVTISSADESKALLLQEIFNSPAFRVYTHDDVIGAELGGALKNVIAIASGICDAMELGHNARAALITRGLAEMRRLGTAMGAKPQTFSGLSGMGDLLLTCTGPLSRNYSLGVQLARGMRLEEVLSLSKSVIEGVATAESAYQLSQKYHVLMPIVEQVYSVLYHGKMPSEAVNDLMSRALRTEFDG